MRFWKFLRMARGRECQRSSDYCEGNFFSTNIGFSRPKYAIWWVFEKCTSDRHRYLIVADWTPHSCQQRQKRVALGTATLAHSCGHVVTSLTRIGSNWYLDGTDGLACTKYNINRFMIKESKTLVLSTINLARIEIGLKQKFLAQNKKTKICKITKTMHAITNVYPGAIISDGSIFFNTSTQPFLIF